MSWFAEALRFPFTGSHRPIPTPEKPIPLFFLIQNLQLAQCSQAGNVLLASAKPRLAHQTAKQRSMICHSSEQVSTAPESNCGVALHHYIWCLALYLVMWGLHAAARPWKPISWRSHCTVIELISMPVKVWNSSAIESAESSRVLNASTFQRYYLQLTVEYLAGMKFHELTYCKGSILSQYHPWIPWAFQNDCL